MEKYEVNQEFVEIICEIRGKVVNSCIDLEMVMDGYIAQHFCETEDRIVEFASIVLAPRVQWREKLAIFSVLIEKYNASFKVEYADFDKDIANIIEHRNVFAHLPADTREIGYKLFKEQGLITFLKFKNSKMPNTKQIVYTRIPSYKNDEINAILKGIHTYTIAIHKMLKIGWIN